VRVPTALGIRTGRFNAVRERGTNRVQIDRAFNALPVDRILGELRDNVGFNAQPVEDTYRERDTGVSINNRQELDDYITYFETAKRPDGSWDLNALADIATYFRNQPRDEFIFPDNVSRVKDFGEDLEAFVDRVRQAFETGGEEAMRQAALGE